MQKHSETRASARTPFKRILLFCFVFFKWLRVKYFRVVGVLPAVDSSQHALCLEIREVILMSEPS